MPWINLARLLAYLRRRGVDPREVIVYLDEDVVDARRRSSLSEFIEPGMATEDNEPVYDDEED